MLRRMLAVLCLLLAASAGWADDAVPDRRVVSVTGQDFYGGDIGSIFDTTLSGCQSTCLRNPACTALTFNTKAGACFLKSGVERVEPFAAAVSARMVETPQATRELATARAAELGFLPGGMLDQARELAATLGGRVAADRGVAESLAAGAAAELTGDLSAAAQDYAAAVALADDADGWRDLARVWLALADAPDQSTPGQEMPPEQRDRLGREAAASALNAYLRSESNAAGATALQLLARTLEQRGMGREMIPALRLAQQLEPRRETVELLDYAISKYGFRVVDHSVNSEPASPRICVAFSEPLAEAGVDYAPYLRVEDHPDLPVEAEGTQLCVEGVAHGERYSLAVREGLPSAEGETLRRTVQIDAYVRDRSPSVRFVGRAYVLPRSAEASIPVVTTNLSEVQLGIYRIGERSLVPAIDDDLFDRAIGQWTEDRLRDRTGEAIWTGTAQVSGPVNADVTTALPVGEAIGQFEPGVYVMTARVPGRGEAWEDAATQWFIVTDLGLASMSGADGVHVFVRALSDAAAVEGAKVQLLARNNQVLGEAATDARGFASFGPGLARGSGGNAPALLTAELAGDFAFMDLTKPPFDLSDRGVEGRPAPGPVDVFATTDRGVYRPGEVVNMTALARDAEAEAIPDLPLTAVVTRPDGVEYRRAVLPDQGAGGRAYALRLGDGVPRGRWSVRLYTDPKAEPVARAAFLVEDFVPERVDFQLDATEGMIAPGAPPVVSLQARYLYGAPASDLPVEGRVEVARADGIPGFPGFRFGLEDEQIGTRVEPLPPLTTGADGTLAFTLPVPQGEPVTAPLQLTALVQVVDGSGRPVERTLTRPLASEAPKIGVRPLFEGAADEGSNARFEIVAVGPGGQQIAMPEVAWTVSRIDRQWQWYEIDGNWNYEPITRRERVASGTVALAADGRATVEAPVTWGEYEMKLAATGEPQAAASLKFSAGWYQPSASTDTPDVLEIGLDREAYAVGDTVEVRLKPRYPGKLLLAVVDNRLIETRVLDVEAGETTADLTVTEAWGPGAYLTATLVRPMDVAAGRNPARALGLAWAGVDPGARELSVEVTTPDRVAPRGPFEAAVRVAGAAPGEAAYVTLAAIDLGILNLTGFEPPAPEDHYFGQRALGVEMRDLYGRLIDGFAGVRGRLRQGGDAERARLKAPPPTEELVAFFSGVVPVGPDGTARASFDLPDFNGTVRVMAVAWTDSAVGHAAKDVLVRDPVIVSVALPRFLAPGDESRLLIELAHAEGPAGETSVVVESDGGIAIPADAARQSVTLEEGRIERIALPLTAVEIGDPRLRILTTTPAGEALTKTVTLPVRLNDPEIARRNRIELAPGGRLVVDAGTFDGLEPGTGHATLAVGPAALFDVPGLLFALDRYPYGCSEQLVSVAMPLLYLGEVVAAMGLTADADIPERIADAIRGVLQNQTGSGAFGLWRPGEGDLWLDAYVTDFLARAKAQGHAVPDRAMQAALDNLRSALSYAGDFQDGGEDIAYALMVLAREGMASIGDLRYYADAKAGDLATPMAKAQLGAALAAYGEQRRADAMFRLAADQLRTQAGEDRGWRPDYGSRLRDAAAVLALAAESRSDAVDAGRLAAEVAAAAEGPTSTQEKAWLLMAARALMGATAGDMTLDGAPVAGPLIRLVDAQALGDGSVAVENAGTAPVPAVLTTWGVPVEPIAAGGNGYRIERAWYTLDGQPVSPDTVEQNTRLAAVLTVTAETDREARLLIDDPLPAGIEIDNPNLLRSGAIAALDWLDSEDEVAMSEFRADRFLAALNRDEAGSFRLAYIVRAVSPGRFHHPAAIVEDMYRPEFRAWTDTGRVEVVPGAR